ncbi:MAG TPA: 2-oxo acid dehydrogenase subunit E2 [Streptosporangiaceae bacterium]|nr:2-oxo acid dehydrogenase subunit E2 [Streptosporangiaceae bacterium]
MARRVRGWRKLAGAAWGPPMDPQFYGDLDVDAAALLSYIDHIRAATGVHVTMTHLVGRAVAHGLAEVPELRVRIARGREHERDSVDVFFIVTAGGGQELTGVKVTGADRKPAVDLAREVSERCTAIGAGHDPDLGRGKALLSRLPPRLLRTALRAGAWLTSDLDWDLSRFGMPRQAFGGAMITSVGMWGISHAYSPLAHYYRVPVLVLVGAVRPVPVVAGGQVVARPMLTLTATFDHRYVDGFHAARFAAAVRDYCAAPARFEPALPSGAAPARATG